MLGYPSSLSISSLIVYLKLFRILLSMFISYIFFTLEQLVIKIDLHKNLICFVRLILIKQYLIQILVHQPTPHYCWLIKPPRHALAQLVWVPCLIESPVLILLYLLVKVWWVLGQVGFFCFWSVKSVLVLCPDDVVVHTAVVTVFVLVSLSSFDLIHSLIIVFCLETSRLNAILILLLRVVPRLYWFLFLLTHSCRLLPEVK